MKPFLFLALPLFLAGCAALGEARSPGEPEFARVRAGMTRDDTARMLGKPLEAMKFARSQSEAWDYQHQDSWGYTAVFSVVFGPQGTVIGTSSRRINDGGDHGL